MNENKSDLMTHSKKELSNKFITTKILDYIIVASMALIFFLVPLFFTNFTMQGFGFDKIVLFYFLTLIGVVAWVIKGVVVGELSLKKTPLDVPILIILLLFGVSTMMSVSVKDSLVGSYGSSSKGLIAIIVYVLFYFLMVNNVTFHRIKLFFGAITASGVLLSFYSLLQITGKYLLPMSFTHAQDVNPIGSMSGLTMYLAMILPLFIVVAAQAKDILPKASKTVLLTVRIIFGLAIISLMVILAFLNSFTFWPVVVTSLVVLLMFYVSRIVNISTKNLTIPAAVLLLSIVFLAMGNFQIGNFNLPAEISLSRGASWGIAKNAISENPIFGSGLSTFDYDFAKYKKIDFNMSPLWDIRFDSSTGAFFELLATIGIPGTLMAVVLFLTSLMILFLALIKNDSNESSPLILGLFSSFISALLLMVMFPQNNSLLLLTILIFILAVTVGIEMYPEKLKTIKFSFRADSKHDLTLATTLLIISSVVIIFFVLGAKMYVADIYIKQAMAIKDPIQKSEKITKAISLANYQDVYYVNSANNYVAIANNLALEKKGQTEIVNSLNSAIEQGKKAVQYAPNRAVNNESLALVYENASGYIRGSLDAAMELYKKVVELDSQNPASYLRMAMVDMAKANIETKEDDKKYYIEEAIKQYDVAIAKKRDFAAAYYGKAIASEKLNKIDDAIEELTNASAIATNNLDYKFELGRLYFNRGITDSKAGQGADKIEKNADLNIAEQLFLSILVDPAQGGNPNHINARYSLAVLYQKIGENDKAKLMADYLVNNVLQDQEIRDAVRAQFKGL